MKIISLKTIVPAVLFGMALSVPSFAQDAPASTDMHQAGQEMKQAGSDTAAAAKDTFHGTERATKDMAITAKVKTALMRDRNVGASGIQSTLSPECDAQGQRDFARESAAGRRTRSTDRRRQGCEQPARGCQLVRQQLTYRARESSPIGVKRESRRLLCAHFYDCGQILCSMVRRCGLGVPT